MKQRKDIFELIKEIRLEIPMFKKDELLEYTKWSIQKLYYSLIKNEKIEIKCKKELIDKLKSEKSKYRISKNIDTIAIQYIELYDFIKKDGEVYVQLYLSVYFYDDVDNNINNYLKKDKYWNDIWIVTYRSSKSNKKYFNCTNCGAIMEYNQYTDIFKCEYCKNTFDNRFNSDWEVVDIQLKDNI